ncbi:MAG: EF-P beta-lysylation protein EpmB [Gammaproteobacteria bacterium]|nr:EF-P beta-lysylation protein EpmB [Gammaproteobacteria bacterium]
MIHRTRPAWQVSSWQRQLAEAFTHPEQLLSFLDIDQALLSGSLPAHRQFGLRVPRWFANRMEKGNPNDPLLRQVLPLGEELRAEPGFLTDPVSDLDQAPVPGVLQKYQGRVLLMMTGACAVNCRYCFRRHYPYGEASLERDQSSAALKFLERSVEISEVILSGGDPLMLSDRRLAELGNHLQSIAHIRRLRIHTRLPVVLPDRLTPELIRGLTEHGLETSMVLHVNHPREISHKHRMMLAPLRERGMVLLNQSVLLKGVNNDIHSLCNLSEKLFSIGVIPYYLHQLDRVAGAAHFEVTDDHALELHQQMQARLPGYLVPRLVRELPGAASKTPIK